MSRALAALTLLVSCALAPLPSHAHSRPLSYSFWSLGPQGAEVKAQLSAAEMELLAAGATDRPRRPEQAARLLQSTLGLETELGPCTASEPRVLPSDAGWVIVRFRMRCPAGTPARISVRLPELLQTGHRHLVRIDEGNGRVLDRVLDLAEPTLALQSSQPDDEAPDSPLLSYVRLGIEHLWTGWDHMAFLLGLLLLARRVREVVVLVTSFTLAHSLTLALATLELLHATPGPVEALIGFSIALLGAENAWLLAGRGRAVPIACVLGLLALLLVPGGVVTRVALLGLALFCASHFALLDRASEPAGLRVVIAFAFGLVHGFGFASILQELELPSRQLALALLGFNLGVELGQLALVVVLWPLLRALASRAESRPFAWLSETASAALCGLGIYWFLLRDFG